MASGDSDRLTDRISIGVLSAVVTADLVDEVLVETRSIQQRTRLLPARVVVYFVLALTLFYGDAYEEVMRKLVQGMQYLRVWQSIWQVPTASALCQARRRLGEAPLRELFHRVAVPIAERGDPGAWLGEFRLMAIDGVRMDVPDTPDNDEMFRRPRNGKGWGPFPQVRVVGLGECGTHAIVAAQIGSTSDGERELAEHLFSAFEPDMLVLADRGFYGMTFFNDAAATGAELLWRVSSTLKLPVLESYPDGSYGSIVQSNLERHRYSRNTSRGLNAERVGTPVRVIEYTVDGNDDDEVIRLITTITDPEKALALDLATAYAERWEFEISLGEMETTQRGPRVFRSQSPEMVRQEVWALLITHYAIRKLIRQAASSAQLDPDRLSFIRALRIVRRQITSQADFPP